MNTVAQNQEVAAQAQEPSTEVVVDLGAMIAALQAIDVEDKQQCNTKTVAAQLNAVIAVLKQMQSGTQAAPARDRGPKSDRDMTEADARAIMLGEYKDASHKVAAEKLGLSYGQVYSARKGFTFKGIYKEMTNGNKASA